MILTVVGARPQFIKAAPVSRALKKAGLQEVMVHTGQHWDEAMSSNIFDDVGLPPPEINLGVRGTGRHGPDVVSMMHALCPVLEARRPDLVLVYGDTNSTLAGALAAVYARVPSAHIEAGVRSGADEIEETNRIMVDHMSGLLFCPTESALINIVKESAPGRVWNVGDVMLDSLDHNIEKARSKCFPWAKPPFGLLTVHRAENDDDDALRSIVDSLPLDWPIVWLAHPRMNDRARRLFFGRSGHIYRNLALRPPGSYHETLALIDKAERVYTDSGGVQREAHWLGTPCTVLRKQHEWPECEAPLGAAFGDGNAAERIAGILAERG